MPTGENRWPGSRTCCSLSHMNLSHMNFSNIDIGPLDPANAADVGAWFELWIEEQRDDPYDPPPSRLAMVGGLGHPWPGQRTEWWIAREGEEIVGTSQLNLPDLDNLGTATADILVSGRHRRRGVGRALFDQLLERTKAEDRVRIIAEVREPLPGSPEQWPAAPFSEAMGAKRALQEIRRRLDLGRLAPDFLPSLEREVESASPGYRLVRWNDDTPDELLKDVAILEGRMSIDPPLGDLHWEPEVFDASRIRGIEDAVRARGRHVYCTGAVHEESGTLVGYTMYGVDPDVSEHAWQWATIVLPEHRGRRLGLRLKLANLAFAREAEPALRTVDTWNAEENTHMIAVNEAMGFVPIELGSEWQLDL